MLVLPDTNSMGNKTQSNEFTELFGTKLAQARVAMALSQRELGELIGVGQTQIVRWEAGKGGPRPDQLFDLCVALGKDPLYLIDPEQVDPIPFREEMLAMIKTVRDLKITLDEVEAYRDIFTAARAIGVEKAYARLMLVEESSMTAVSRPSPTYHRSGPVQNLLPKPVPPKALGAPKKKK